MRITRCPRCRAEDIAADAHPTRVLRNGESVPVFVCRNCYRAAELEYRITCDAAGITYLALPVREGLRLLRDFYLDRYGEWQDPALLMRMRTASPPPPASGPRSTRSSGGSRSALLTRLPSR